MDRWRYNLRQDAGRKTYAKSLCNMITGHAEPTPIIRNNNNNKKTNLNNENTH